MTQTPSPPPIPPAPPAMPAEPPLPLEPPLPAPLPGRQPIWPKALGIISLIVGAVVMLHAGVSVVQRVVFRAMSRATSRTPGPAGGPAVPFDPFAMYDTPDWHHYSLIAAHVLGALVAGLLMWAGVVLIRRRPLARKLHRWYAPLQVGVAVALAVLTAMSLQLTAGQPGGSGPFGDMPRRMFRAQIVLMAATPVVYGLVYPVFVLIWFGRRTIREQVDQWPETGGA